MSYLTEAMFADGFGYHSLYYLIGIIIFEMAFPLNCLLNFEQFHSLVHCNNNKILSSSSRYTTCLSGTFYAQLRMRIVYCLFVSHGLQCQQRAFSSLNIKTPQCSQPMRAQVICDIS